jgi:hypothetical protein
LEDRAAVEISTARKVVVAVSAAAVMAIAAPQALAAVGRASDPNHRLRFGASANWSGYAVSGFGPYTTVSASWTQPAVECASTPRAFSAFWVGLDGAPGTSRTVEQTGTEAICSPGGASYTAWYEMAPKRAVVYSVPVAAGDSISASVTALAKGHFQLTISDVTQQWSLTTTQKRKSAKRASAEVIAEAPSTRRGALPLADFGTIGFGEVAVDGAALSSSTPGIEPITMTFGGTVKAQPSSITPASFSVAWQHE